MADHLMLDRLVVLRQEQDHEVLADFEGEWGDRRQELVFIGIRMQTEAVTAALNACLATPEDILQVHLLYAYHSPCNSCTLESRWRTAFVHLSEYEQISAGWMLRVCKHTRRTACGSWQSIRNAFL